MEKMDRYGGFLDLDEITGSGISDESVGKGRKPPFYGYGFDLLGRPPYRQTGTY